MYTGESNDDDKKREQRPPDPSSEREKKKTKAKKRETKSKPNYRIRFVPTPVTNIRRFDVYSGGTCRFPFRR